MAAPQFDVSPETQASFPRFMYHQVTAKPQLVEGIDLSGRTALVTGSNSGIGLETSRQLLDLGVTKLILAVRDEEKGKAAAAELLAGRKNPQPDIIEVWRLDLSSYDSVVAFADRATKTLTRLDVAILNAGFCPSKRIVNTATGHDEIIQVNYLSTALLAILLLPVARRVCLSQPQPTRITLTLSEVANWARFPVGKELPILAALDTPGGLAENTSDRMFVSKLLGLFFVRALANKVPPSVAVIDAASPGAIHDSQFNRDIDKTLAGPVMKMILRRVGNSSAVGARMMTDAAVAHGEEVHGQFLSFQKIVPMPPIVYTGEGAKISDQLWNETMDELSFANAATIVEKVFLATVSETAVIVSDYRKVKDILSQWDTVDFKHGLKVDAFRGIVPHAFSAMETLYPDFHNSRNLGRDLMTPSMLLTYPLLRRRSQRENMVKQMPLQWEARHHSESPDPLYVTVAPPEVIHKSQADQVLDDAHQRAFELAVTNILSTPIAEETFAEIVDGLPLRSVAIGTQNHRILRGHPIEKHDEMCSGAIEKTREFKNRFDALRLEIASAALQQYQDTPVGSRASKMPFLELVAVTLHAIAVELFELVDGGFHKNATWPSDEAYKNENWTRWPTPFCLFHYSKPEQYPDGTADVAGYWAEDRIFGGVVLFGRGDKDARYDGIWFHSHREDVTKRIYKLTEEQSTSLLQFIEKGLTNESMCPLPILGDINNRLRVDEEIAIPEFNIYRDRWERTVDYSNWHDYCAQKHCCREAIDWPELLDLQKKNLELNG